MTRRELNLVKESVSWIGGTIKTGYCCLQDFRVDHPDLQFIEIGTNLGVYGWNWTAYYSPNYNVLFIDGYRNF